MPSGPGVIDDETIARIAATVPPGIASVLLTSRTDPEEIAAQQRTTRVNAMVSCDMGCTSCAVASRNSC